MATLQHADLPYRWLGGRLCLDFANTVAWLTGDGGREAGRPRPGYERLTGYARLAQWAREADVLNQAQTTALLEAADAAPDAAARVLESALVLRDAIHRLFVSLGQGSETDDQALRILNDGLRGALTHRLLIPAPGGAVWTWANDDCLLEQPLWPVALDTAEILTSDDVRRVRQCAGDDCGFLFLDKGRGPGRRWCTMAHCGNRAKARRHHSRLRARE